MGELLKRVLGSHLSKFLSAVGSIFQFFCPLEVQFFKFTSFYVRHVCFICLLFSKFSKAAQRKPILASNWCGDEKIKLKTKSTTH